MDVPQYETFTVELTRTELLELGQKLSNEIGKIAALKSQLSTTQSVVKGKLLEHETEVARLSKLIREGKEEREVELEEQPDYNSREIILQRKDTFAEVRRRPMNEDEIQKHFQKNLFEPPSVDQQIEEASALLGEPPDERTVAEAAGVSHTDRMAKTQRGKA